jgi:hypothetical protein
MQYDFVKYQTSQAPIPPPTGAIALPLSTLPPISQ